MQGYGLCDARSNRAGGTSINKNMRMLISEDDDDYYEQKQKKHSSFLPGDGNFSKSIRIRYPSASRKRIDRFILENHAIILRVVVSIICIVLYFI